MKKIKILAIAILFGFGLIPNTNSSALTVVAPVKPLKDIGFDISKLTNLDPNIVEHSSNPLGVLDRFSVLTPYGLMCSVNFPFGTVGCVRAEQYAFPGIKESVNWVNFKGFSKENMYLEGFTDQVPAETAVNQNIAKQYGWVLNPGNKVITPGGLYTFAVNKAGDTVVIANFDAGLQSKYLGFMVSPNGSFMIARPLPKPMPRPFPNIPNIPNIPNLLKPAPKKP